MTRYLRTRGSQDKYDLLDDESGRSVRFSFGNNTDNLFCRNQSIRLISTLCLLKE